jgi:hypothetical protein
LEASILPVLQILLNLYAPIGRFVSKPCGAYKFVKADVAFRYIGCYFGATAMAAKNLSAFGAEKKYRKICNIDL